MCRRAAVKIQLASDSGTGVIATYQGRVFVMTCHQVVPDAHTARSSIAVSDYEDGGRPVVTALLPDELFDTNKALDVSVVACTIPDDCQPVRLLAGTRPQRYRKAWYIYT